MRSLGSVSLSDAKIKRLLPPTSGIYHLAAATALPVGFDEILSVNSSYVLRVFDFMYYLI